MASPLTRSRRADRDSHDNGFASVAQDADTDGAHGYPEDVSEAAIFLASEAAGFITGEVLDVNGGMLTD